MDRTKRKVAVAGLSVVSNTLLILFKVMVGLIMGSVSILSEAIHSGVDLLAALIAFLAVRTSGKPPDTDHPFGHGKVENISGTIEALLIVLAAAWIIYEAVSRLFDPSPIESPGWGVGVMLISCLANWFVSRKLFAVGRATESVALEADAWHLRTDVYTSAGVMAALGTIWVCRWLFPSVAVDWLDPVAAIAVALLILRAAWRLTIASMRDLMDVTLPEEEETFIRNLIATMYPRVHGFHRLKTRKAGPDRFIEFHMKVEPLMSVESSHAITGEISRLIKERFPYSTVTIHIEPCDGKCGTECRTHCFLSEGQRKDIQQS